MTLVKILDRSGCKDVVMGLPAVVSIVVSLPLDQILDAPVSGATIKDLLDLVSGFTIY
jgi:hypothetical protein